MKTKLVLLTLVSAFSLQPSALLGQGSLTPPSAPAPTMKTLTQVEPRTPISSAPLTISTPGSYYLTTNLTVSSGNAIAISVNGVTLDLGGFTIASTSYPVTNYAILLNSGLRNVTILNGFIQGGVTNNGTGVFNGSGFGYGISYSGTAPANVLVSRVSVCGCLFHGIRLGMGDSCVVDSCTVRTVGSYGISATTIKGSVARDCGSTAIGGYEVSDCQGESYASGVSATTVQNCRGSSLGDGHGISATSAQNCYGWSSGNGAGIAANTALNCYGVGSGTGHGVTATTAQNCYGSSNSGDGINAGTAQNCYGSSTSGNGVYALRSAQNCYGVSTGGDGINVGIAQNCYGSSTSGNGLYALQVADTCYGSSAGNNVAGVRAATAENCRGDNSGTSFGYGLRATHSAQNCYGYSASYYGISATVAQNCYAYSTNGIAGLSAWTAQNCYGYCIGSGIGLSAADVAIGCVGYSESGIGLSAYIANSCRVTHGTMNVTFKYNMP